MSEPLTREEEIKLRRAAEAGDHFSLDSPTIRRLLATLDAARLAPDSLTRLREALDAVEKALQIGYSSYDGDPWYAEHDNLVKMSEGHAAMEAGFTGLAKLRAALGLVEGGEPLPGLDDDAERLAAIYAHLAPKS